MTKREQVYERAQGRSDLTGMPLRRDAWECHHRRPGRMGGTELPDQQSLANQLALAPGEHNMRPDSVHMRPRWATERGLLVPSGRGLLSVPHLVPVWWRGREWVYLTPDGEVVPATPPASTGGPEAGGAT